MSETLNIKPVYKSSPLRLIPIDWEVKEFGDFAEIIMGQSPEGHTYNQSAEGVALINGPTEFTEKYPLKKQWTTSPTKLCKQGDVLLCVRGSSIGRINIANDVYCIGRGIAAIRAKKNSVHSFLVYQIENVVNKILVLTTGSTFPNIDSKSLREIEINLPPLAEQTAIANLLNTWDTAIQKTTALIAQKESRKKWLMQQLLAGKKRLKRFEIEKWKMKLLEDVLSLTLRPVKKPQSLFVALGIRSHGKGTFLKHDFEPSKIEMDTLFEVKENDLIVNITFAWEGAIAIVRKQDEGALVSHRFPTFTFNSKDGIVNFFRHLILHPRFRYLLKLISPGGAGRNRVLSKKDFLKLEVKIPLPQEQTAIANILQSADKEIQLLKNKLEKLKEQKKGLMQVLLTGKKRLKIDN